MVGYHKAQLNLWERSRLRGGSFLMEQGACKKNMITLYLKDIYLYYLYIYSKSYHNTGKRNKAARKVIVSRFCVQVTLSEK